MDTAVALVSGGPQRPAMPDGCGAGADVADRGAPTGGLGAAGAPHAPSDTISSKAPTIDRLYITPDIVDR
ncbi:MAG: hypothetical protein ACM3JP_02230 [Betaproteobacteria bacterium]